MNELIDSLFFLPFFCYSLLFLFGLVILFCFARSNGGHCRLFGGGAFIDFAGTKKPVVISRRDMKWKNNCCGSAVSFVVATVFASIEIKCRTDMAENLDRAVSSASSPRWWPDQGPQTPVTGRTEYPSMNSHSFNENRTDRLDEMLQSNGSSHQKKKQLIN